MTEGKVKKLGKGSSQSASSSVIDSVLDPLSAALEGSDPLSQMAAQAAAAAATQVTDPLSQMAAQITDPLSRISISKVCVEIPLIIWTLPHLKFVYTNRMLWGGGDLEMTYTLVGTLHQFCFKALSSRIRMGDTLEPVLN